MRILLLLLTADGEKQIRSKILGFAEDGTKRDVSPGTPSEQFRPLGVHFVLYRQAARQDEGAGLLFMKLISSYFRDR